MQTFYRQTFCQNSRFFYLLAFCPLFSLPPKKREESAPILRHLRSARKQHEKQRQGKLGGGGPHFSFLLSLFSTMIPQLTINLDQATVPIAKDVLSLPKPNGVKMVTEILVSLSYQSDKDGRWGGGDGGGTTVSRLPRSLIIQTSAVEISYVYVLYIFAAIALKLFEFTMKTKDRSIGETSPFLLNSLLKKFTNIYLYISSFMN